MIRSSDFAEISVLMLRCDERRQDQIFTLLEVFELRFDKIAFDVVFDIPRESQLQCSKLNVHLMK